MLDLIRRIKSTASFACGRILLWNKWYHGLMGDKPGDHAPLPNPSPAE
jgi:hypothetical protein